MEEEKFMHDCVFVCMHLFVFERDVTAAVYWRDVCL
jgi:hypothetical protein